MEEESDAEKEESESEMKDDGDDCCAKGANEDRLWITVFWIDLNVILILLFSTIWTFFYRC